MELSHVTELMFRACLVTWGKKKRRIIQVVCFWLCGSAQLNAYPWYVKISTPLKLGQIVCWVDWPIYIKKSTQNSGRYLFKGCVQPWIKHYTVINNSVDIFKQPMHWSIEKRSHHLQNYMTIWQFYFDANDLRKSLVYMYGKHAGKCPNDKS